METKFEKCEAFDVVSALNYNPDSPMFRTIMNTHKGSVDLVALDKATHLNEHPAPDDVMVLLLEGEVDFHITGTVQRLMPGNVLLLEKGTLHSVHPLRDSKILLIKIEP